MNKLIVLMAILIPLLYVVSCSKSTGNGYYTCAGVAVDADSSALLSYAQTNNITVTKDTSGFYYQIVTQGSGGTPIGTSKIYVNYVGKFLNGTTFDSTTSTREFELDSLIVGWQYAIPKIQPGGRMKLLLPSALAYGCVGAGTVVPSNTPVYFDITLVSFH